MVIVAMALFHPVSLYLPLQGFASTNFCNS
jgi:hypothetical protein